MKGLIDAVESSNDADVAPFVSALQRFRPGACEADASATTVGPASGSIDASITLTDAVREFLIECRENIDQAERDLVALEEAPDSPALINSIFRAVHTLKGGAGFLGYGVLERLAHAAESMLAAIRGGQRVLTSRITSCLLAAIDKCREGVGLVERSGTDAALGVEGVLRDLRALDETDATTDEPCASREAETPPAVPLPRTAPATRPAAAPAEPIAGEKGSAAVAESTIRVDVCLLDKLMTRVGELVLARNQILQHAGVMEDSAFISTAQRLNLITTELQESVMKTRMRPIGNVWAKFPRVVRDLASQLGKQVRIEMEGKETELDKTIVEAIKDPLTHLVRNSVDHGIETPEARRQAGKPIEGRLFLRAFHEGGQVNIEISDDGAGLNVDRIRRKALERGLISGDQAARMTDREAAQIILLPGFSTAEKVTSVSGRGVGMDVVKTNIECIGGMIDVQSRPGKGTTVKIKIPLTLAIIPALIVTNGGDRYAIPQVSLLELVRLEGEQVTQSIEYVHGAPVYRLRGKLLPLVNLSERLGLTDNGARSTDGSSDAEKVLNIVVLRAADRQFGLIVDRVNDTEEIVVKPLSRHLKNLSEYAGATIMGDGAVALILDVMGLAVASGLATEMRETGLGANSVGEAKSGRTTQTLLVVDLGDSRRFALPTSMVSRLEKVRRSEIELADDREVIQYRGAILPLVRLSDVFGESAGIATDTDDLQVVVYSDEQHRCGLVVRNIVDIVETELKLESSQGSDHNLLGTSVIQQRVTDVVNPRNLARRHSQWSSGALAR
ncbi:MAG: chemotaxis protein CheA [Planctomycetes bacterium]|nr:chemotaxis protein CheA [Planctomycetota bacterium]